jgi:radical SAM-linked protein
MVTKTGRTTSLSHLEYMTLVHRAVRRAGLPIRYSAGYHPAPRISFGDALPLGVASEAEIIDLEVTTWCEPQEVAARLNSEFPNGVTVTEAHAWPRRGESPAKSIAAAIYSVPIPADFAAGLEERLAEFLCRDQVMVTRVKKNRSEAIDLRPWVADLNLENGLLWMKMSAGSPLFLAAHLMQMEVEEVRGLGICKTAVELKDFVTQVDL